MQHKKSIAPLHYLDDSVEQLPDRSDLAELYIRHTPDDNSKNNGIKPGLKAGINRDLDSEIRFEKGILTSLLLIPAVVTFTTAQFIINGTENNLDSPDPFLPLSSFFVSGIAVISTALCARIIYKLFDNYTLGLGTFIGIFTFYAMPLLKIAYSIPKDDLYSGVLIVIAGYAVVYLLLLLIEKTLNNVHLSKSKQILILATPVLILGLVAAVL